jgi:hypothetical protein
VSFALLGANASRWSVVKLESLLSESHNVSTWNQQQEETGIVFTMRLLSVWSVVVMWYFMRIFLKYLINTLLLPPPYVRLDTVFVDNSISTRLDNIEDNLTNWTSPGEWKFTATSAKKKQHNTRSIVSEREGRSQIPLMTWQQS